MVVQLKLNEKKNKKNITATTTTTNNNNMRTSDVIKFGPHLQR